MHIEVHPAFSVFSHLSENPSTQNIISIVPVKNDATDARYGTQNQSFYISEMQNACKTAVDLIFKQKEGFQTVLKQIGELRQEIAKKQKSDFAENFGKLRKTNNFNDRISTPLMSSNEYGRLLDILMQIDETDPMMEWECYSKMEEKGMRMGFRLGICHDEKVVKLSRYFFSTLGIERKGNVIAHTYPENLTRALNECQFLFDHLVCLDATEKNSIQKYMAEFHWWFIQATPYFRGTAACAEIFMSAFNKHFFQQPVVWKEGIYPDRIALTCSLDEFVAAYPSLHQ